MSSEPPAPAGIPGRAEPQVERHDTLSPLRGDQAKRAALQIVPGRDAAATWPPYVDDPDWARYRVRFIERDWLDSGVFVDHRGSVRLTSLRELRGWLAA